MAYLLFPLICLYLASGLLFLQLIQWMNPNEPMEVWERVSYVVFWAFFVGIVLVIGAVYGAWRFVDFLARYARSA